MKRATALVIVSIIMLAYLVLPASTVFASSSDESPKVIFILVNNVSWADIINSKNANWDELIETSAIGLQNNRPLSAPSWPRSALTAGAGLRAEADAGSLDARNSYEPLGDEAARNAYFVRTGRRVGGNQICEPGIAQVIANNAGSMQDFVPGRAHV